MIPIVQLLGIIAVFAVIMLHSRCQSSSSASRLDHPAFKAYLTAEHTQALQTGRKALGQVPVVLNVLNTTADVLPEFFEVAKAEVQLEQRGLGKKVIAVSLFGSDPRYTMGAVENALLAKRDWPGWTYRVYYGAGIPADILEAIQVRHSVRYTCRRWAAILATTTTVVGAHTPAAS